MALPLTGRANQLQLSDLGSGLFSQLRCFIDLRRAHVYYPDHPYQGTPCLHEEEGPTLSRYVSRCPVRFIDSHYITTTSNKSATVSLSFPLSAFTLSQWANGLMTVVGPTIP